MVRGLCDQKDQLSVTRVIPESGEKSEGTFGISLRDTRLRYTSLTPPEVPTRYIHIKMSMYLIGGWSEGCDNNVELLYFDATVWGAP